MSNNQYKAINSKNGNEIFKDTSDHYENAVLRLMNVSETIFVDFICAIDQEIIQNCGVNFNAITKHLRNIWFETINTHDSVVDLEKKEILTFLPTCFGDIKFNQFVELASDNRFGIVFDDLQTFGVLVHAKTMERVKNSETSYEESYFDGDVPGLGYGDFSQQLWRLEKAKRQVENIELVLQQIGYPKQLSEMSFLDVGSGNGVFLNSLQSAGAEVLGLDISHYAASKAMNEFGVKTFIGSLSELNFTTTQKFDAITMWDYIEHPDDPGVELNLCRDMLKDGGLIIIKTPNLDSLEFDVFSSYYHSLKHEHLNYFTLRSITNLLLQSGFSLVYSQGVSHLLSGFKPIDLCSLARVNKKESDLFLIARGV